MFLSLLVPFALLSGRPPKSLFHCFFAILNFAGFRALCDHLPLTTLRVGGFLGWILSLEKKCLHPQPSCEDQCAALRALRCCISRMGCADAAESRRGGSCGSVSGLSLKGCRQRGVHTGGGGWSQFYSEEVLGVPLEGHSRLEQIKIN